MKVGFYKGYDVRMLEKMRGEGEPHPEDHLIEEFKKEYNRKI